MLTRQQITPENAAQAIAKLHEKVKVDITRLANHMLKPLKRKQSSETKPDEDKANEEIKVKEEIDEGALVLVPKEGTLPMDVDADDWGDVDMGKQELARTGLSLQCCVTGSVIIFGWKLYIFCTFSIAKNNVRPFSESKIK